MTLLLADHEQIDRFFRTVFPYASVGQTISVRAFFEEADKATSEYKGISAVVLGRAVENSIHL